ncbi:MAG: hypothetical protein AAGB00_04705 [Planctomycetota bacterium]
MRLTQITIALAAACTAGITLAEGNAPSGVAIRWLGEGGAQPAIYSTPAADVGLKRFEFPKAIIAPMTEAPVTEAPKPVAVVPAPVTAAPADRAPMPTPLPPVVKRAKVEAPQVVEAKSIKSRSSEPKPAKEIAAKRAAKVATKPAAAPRPVDVKPTPEATARQTAATSQPIYIVTTPQAAPQPASRGTAGGRWQVESRGNRQRFLTGLLADPFQERRPSEWNGSYGPTATLSPVRLMSGAPVAPVVVAAPAVTQVNYAAGQAAASPTGGCGADACGTAGCSECSSTCGCNCCCGPKWSFGVDALFLWRDAPDSHTPLVVCNCVDPTLHFDPSGFDLDAAAGPRFRAFRHAPCGPDFEIAYFNIDSWDDSRYFYGDLTVGGVNLGPNTSATVNYSSQLQSFEANLVRDHGCWTRLITGFRWIQLDEHSSVYGSNGATSVYQSSDTENNLYGGQFGFRRLLYDYGGCLTLDSSVKAGVFGSDIDRQTVGYGVGHLSDGGVSFVGDVEFQANFEITCRCTLTAGYQLLWITGLASAPEQFHALDYINNGETIFYHGANIGMVYSW